MNLQLIPFQFFDPGELRDAELWLKLCEVAPAMGNRAPTYRFEMQGYPRGERVGAIELRVGTNPDILTYTGHIGYHVDLPFRGRRYAARGCHLLFALARRHGFQEIWLTCDPENGPSYRTCQLIGGELVNTVPVPKNHAYYKVGSRAKCRFRVRV